MNNKKVDQEERSKELKKREELEKLIQNTADEITVDIDKANDVLPGKKQVFMDYQSVKEHLDNEANDIILSIAEFYLDEEIVNNIEYVKQKTKVDHLTISSLLFQMKTAEHAIIKLLGEIDDGNLNPRMFEVLASLQRSKMEIVKHLAQFMIIMENNYKNLKDDYRIKKAEKGSSDEDEEGESKGFKMRGSKALLQAIHAVEQEGEDEDSIENVTESTKRPKKENNQDE